MNRERSFVVFLSLTHFLKINIHVCHLFFDESIVMFKQTLPLIYHRSRLVMGICFSLSRYVNE